MRAAASLLPDVAAIRRVRGWSVPGALAAVAVLVGWQVLAAGPLVTLDGRVHDAVAGLAGGGVVHGLLYAAAELGARGVLLGVAGAVAGTLALRRRSRRPVLLVLAAVGALSLLVLAAKAGVARTAPRSGLDAVRAGGSSFPSGHAANAVAVWGLLAHLLRTRWARVTAAVVAAVVGVAVVLLDYHWVSDVVAGWAAGGLVLWVVLAADARRRPQPSSSAAARRSAPVSPA